MANILLRLHQILVVIVRVWERARMREKKVRISVEKMLNLVASLSWYVFSYIATEEEAKEEQHIHPCRAAWFGYMKPLSRFKKVCTWAHLNANQTITSGNMPIHATDGANVWLGFWILFYSFFSSSAARICETTTDTERREEKQQQRQKKHRPNNT